MLIRSSDISFSGKVPIIPIFCLLVLSCVNEINHFISPINYTIMIG